MGASRRFVLGGLLGLPLVTTALGWSAPAWARVSQAVFPHSEIAADLRFAKRLAALARDRVSAAALCHEAGLDDHDWEEVARDLCPEPALRQRLAEAPSSDLRLWLDGRIREDFAQARTVRLDGWILSRSEVAVAALSAKL